MTERDRMGHKRQRRQLCLWQCRGPELPLQTRLFSDSKGTSGGRRWLPVLRTKKSTHALLCTKLLRRIRQRRGSYGSLRRSDLLVQHPPGNLISNEQLTQIRLRWPSNWTLYFFFLFQPDKKKTVFKYKWRLRSASSSESKWRWCSSPCYGSLGTQLQVKQVKQVNGDILIKKTFRVDQIIYISSASLLLYSVMKKLLIVRALGFFINLLLADHSQHFQALLDERYSYAVTSSSVPLKFRILKCK